MNVRVSPAFKLQGEVFLPASKSYSIRAFIIAACGGRSKIVRPSDCDDSLVSIQAARSLGAQVSHREHTWSVKAFHQKKRSLNINVKESGTVLRLLLPILPLYTKNAFVTGEGTLHGRPNLHLIQTLKRMGLNIKGTGQKASIPIKIQGGNLKTGKVQIDGTTSSQFISALLIACPRLEKDTHLIIKGKKIVSLDYIAMTLQVLKKTGIKIKVYDDRNYLIYGNQKFKGIDFTVPSDYGLAAFLMAAGCLIRSRLTFKGVFNDRFTQADGAILGLLKKMGAKFKRTKNAIVLQGPFVLKGGDFSLRNCPDLLPIMAVLALFAKGRTRLYDIKHARVKESDRISDLRQELLKVGANIKESQNELVISPRSSYRSHQILDPHRDHRLAMAFCVLGLKIGLQVSDIHCINKSYPGFLRDIRSLGASIR